jgi:hypothetical protein
MTLKCKEQIIPNAEAVYAQGPKFFVVNTVISNFLRLNGLQSICANPAPGRGTPEPALLSQNRTRREAVGNHFRERA